MKSLQNGGFTCGNFATTYSVVIVTCPNCGAQYRLPETVSVVGKRMRCADCDHRWAIEAPSDPPSDPPSEPAPETLAETPAEAAPPQADAKAPLQPTPEANVPGQSAQDESAPDAEAPVYDELDEEPAGRGLGWLWWLAGLVMLLLGGVVALVALERLDPARVPLVGEALARLQAGPSPLVIEAEARFTPLPGGAMVLEVKGELRNSGRLGVDVGALKATLGGVAVGGGTSVARRWSIALPTKRLEAGASVAFSSTLTDVPGGATQLRITTGR